MNIIQWYFFISIICLLIISIKTLIFGLIEKIRNDESDKKEREKFKDKVNDISIQYNLSSIQIYILMIIIFMICPGFFLGINIIDSIKELKGDD